MNKNKLSEEVRKSVPKSIFEMDEKTAESIKSLTGAVLAVVGAVGILAVAAVAPNLMKLVKIGIDIAKYTGKNSKLKSKKIARVFYYLKSKDYIKIKESPEGLVVLITDKGKRRLLQMKTWPEKIIKPKSWDGKWWLVLADIPSKMRYQADCLRKKAKDLKMVLLQRTVWVYPHDPRAEMGFISSHYGLDKFLLFVKSDYIDDEDENKLKEHFKKIGIV